MNVCIYLPKNFYSTAASITAEALLAMNTVKGEEFFKLSFVSRNAKAKTNLGISFPTTKLKDNKIDLLIILAAHPPGINDLEKELEEEADFAKKVIAQAVRSNGIIAGTCSASLLMAQAGLLDGKRATVAWWVKEAAAELFPNVKWDASRIIVRHGNIFTSGGVLSAFDLMTTVLVRLGFTKDVRTIRKFLVAPPLRQIQSLYEIDWNAGPQNEFEELLDRKATKIGLRRLGVASLTEALGCSGKTLTRKFQAELGTTPSKWIQKRRLTAARELLETTSFSVAKLCNEIGYEDQASFTRLFCRAVGVTPSEYRKQVRI